MCASALGLNCQLATQRLKREWGKLHTKSNEKLYSNIAGISAQNTVLNTTYVEIPASQYRRRRLGGDRPPIVKRKRSLNDAPWLRLASLTSKKSPFKHECAFSVPL